MRLAPGTAWECQREELARVWAEGEQGRPWPLRRAVRRCAWQVLGHAWEVEDRSN